MNLIVNSLGTKDYLDIWHKMQHFTVNRNEQTIDQLWLLQHPPVYTQGQAGKPEHILNTQNIPIVQSDRGGQVTYHGPGQLVAYVLIDLKRKKLGIRTLVCKLESIIIELLRKYHIDADTKQGAPGVYVDDKKICSIGLRVKKGCTYHGIALNVDMDLKPFKGINPCGFNQLKMTQIKNYCDTITLNDIMSTFIPLFFNQLEYDPH
jgi:lipoyl(octanoyl) transferase